MAMELSETGSLSESNSTSERSTSLMPMLDPPLHNVEIAHGFVAEMTMSKEDFDHLLFDNTISATMEESFCVPMTVETRCQPVETESPDCGFCDDLMSTDTDYSVPTSPSPSSTADFLHSPSSESGIEEDDEDGDSKIEGFEVTQALTGLCKSEPENPLSTLLGERQCAEACPQASSVEDAFEELKQLLYTVASEAQTSSPASSKPIMSGFPFASLPTVPTTSNLMTGMSNLPISTEVVSSSSTIPTATQNGSVTASRANSERYDSMVPESSKAKCVRKTRKAREKPKLVILDEPEENYRARYESEGCRGPIHGSCDNSYPTIKVSGYNGPVWITVYLVTSSGSPHYHSIHGPGSTKVPCKEITLPGGIPAVQLMVDPDSKMTAVMDSLSIRRLRNWEGDKELKKRGIDPRTWKRERKEARLLFQAEITGENGQPATKLTCKSRIFQCSSSGPTGSPEIWWTSRTEGSVEGKEEVGLIGKKFPSDLKVRFYADLPSGHTWESYAEVDKSKTHQGAAVVLTPPFSDQDILFPVKVNIELVNGNAKNGKCSEPIEFTYTPRKDIMTASVTPCGHSLGGILAGLPGGLITTTPQSLSSLLSIATPTTPVIPDVHMTMMSSIVVPEPSKKELDVNDWQKLCIQIKELQQNGLLDSHQIKNLCSFIQRKDLLLLQAFRSANNAGTQDECRTKFKQYLMGLVGTV